MHTEAKLVGEVRTKLGTLAAKKLRKGGRVPANIYGHNQPPVAFSVPEDGLLPLVKSGVKVVDVELEGKTDKAVLLEVQWDTFGTYIKHFDLLRVDPDEKLTVEVPLEIRGIAPGTLSGGVLEFGLRHLTIQCLAIQIPDHIAVKVGDLQLNQAIHVRDIEPPPNTVFMDNPDTVVVRVVQLHVSEAELAPEGMEGATQPELIGRKPAEEEEEA